MKTIGLGVFCVLLAGAGRVWGQSVLSGKQNPIEQTDYYAKVPFESIKGIPVIPVEIGGKTYRFMLDTGAPTLLSDKLSKQLGLKPLTKLDVQDANAQSDSVQAVLLPSLKVSGLNFVNQPVLVGNPPFLFDCLGVQGILGSNFLRSSVVQFSYPTRTVIIASDAGKLALDASTAAEMLVEPTQSLPIIGLCFTGKDVAQRDVCEQLLFDTGADTFYDLATAHLVGLSQIKALTVQRQAEGGDNMSLHGVQKPTVQYQALVPEMAVNGARFRNVTTTTTPDNNSRLGNALLKHGLVTVDYKNRKFYFAPFTSAGVDLQGENRRPLNPTLTAGKLSVGIIWSKKLAQQIAVGDQILSVDGVSCEQLSTCDIINHKYPAVRTGSRLKIKTKQGQTKEVVLAAE